MLKKIHAHILNWIGTVSFLSLFAGLLVLFDPLQRLALAVKRSWHEQVVGALNVALVSALQMVGARISVHGSSDFDAARCTLDRPLVVVSNHQSLFDVPILHSVFRKYNPRFVAKMQLAHGIPSVSFNLRHGENALIDRKCPLQAMRVLSHFAQLLREGRFAAILFPEGTRARDGAMRAFHTTGLQVLLKEVPNALVIPVAIDGSWQIAQNHLLPIPFGTHIHLAVGTPIPVSNYSNLKAAVHECEGKVRSMLAMLRLPVPPPK